MSEKTSPYNVIADQVRQNANALLDIKRISSRLKEMGELYFTGSYALDLMTWNDIDMQLVVKDDVLPLDALTKIFNDLSQEKGFIEAQIINFTGEYKPKMPRGIYLGLKFDLPDLGGIWKLDLWTLEKEDFERNRALIEQLKNTLNKNTRALILEIKHDLMKATGRIPQMGSHWLYQAILINGLSEKEAIFDFLRNKGVALETPINYVRNSLV